jgi:O-antigen biosynthesis protein
MTDAARVSVIVVSQDRPDDLHRCLKGLSQMDHPCFEVVVVTRPSDMQAVPGLPVRTVAFAEANISAARNAGLAVAAGEIVAFIDDDAVPEPTWLSRLTAPFADPDVVLATGFVRGRNGISLQSRAAVIDHLGETRAIDVGGTTILPSEAGRAVKAVGTNAAFRRDSLCGIGGFDPAFRFYLDDSDVSIRLARSGGSTAIVPDAQVHHGYAASVRRRGDRVPTDLTEIGASVAVFLRKHAGDDAAGRERALLRFRHDQRARLVRHMVAGRIEPGHVIKLLQTLEAGMSEGARRMIGPLPPISEANSPFLPVPSSPRQGVALSGRPWQARRLRKAAARDVAQSKIVTLVLLSPTARPHRMRFTRDGVWEQRGGLFGRSDRSEPILQWWSFHSRVAREAGISGRFRPL